MMAELFAKFCRLLLQQFCPPEKAAPRQAWMSESTWEVVKWSAAVRASCFNARRAARRLFLLGAFAGWQRVAAEDILEHDLVAPSWGVCDWQLAKVAAQQFCCFRRAAYMEATMKVLAKRIRHLAKCDRQNWVQAEIDMVQADIDRGCSGKMWKFVKS